MGSPSTRQRAQLQHTRVETGNYSCPVRGAQAPRLARASKREAARSVSSFGFALLFEDNQPASACRASAKPQARARSRRRLQTLAPHSRHFPPLRARHCIFRFFAQSRKVRRDFHTQGIADSREAAAQAARGPEEPTVAREDEEDRPSPLGFRLWRRILPRGMACHVW